MYKYYLLKRLQTHFYFTLLLLVVPFMALARLDHISLPTELDPVLINGKKYSFYKSNVEGNQFLNENGFTKGSVTINGKQYEDLQLNIDIYNQQLVLLYNAIQGNERKLVMSDAWITTFSIGLQNFEFISLDNDNKQIFQVIGEGSFKVLYHWNKQMTLNPNSGRYFFSPSYKTSYLLVNGVFLEYKNNRSFINCFKDNSKQLVKRFLKENKIKVSKLNDSGMDGLMEYCNSLISN